MTASNRAAVALQVQNVADRVCAAAALIVLSPLVGAVSIWMWVTQGRPVLFVQQHAALDGKPFQIWKFRTMVNDAIGVGQRLGLTDDPFGLVEEDPRIMRSGGLLRRTSLDELPQLLKVVLGEMSLVGPAPAVLSQVAHYGCERIRLDVKPGITGWAQVNGRDQLTWPERFELDQWYVGNWSLRPDCKIHWMTPPTLALHESPPMTDDFNMRRRQGVDGE